MVGFIELHFRVDGKQPTKAPVPFLLAVERIATVQPCGDCAYIDYSNVGECIQILVQESYDEVVAILQTFQRQWAAAAAPKKPLVRTHKRPQHKS